MAENAESAGQRDRSPSYPLIPLEAALDRLADFEAHFKRSPARPDKVQGAWGIKAKARVDRIAAALRYFGLLDYQGAGKNRQIVISEEGRKYLRAQQDEIKREVVKAAALRPKEIARYWDEWGEDRPADAACLDDLVLERKFSERGARQFLKVYDATITFAGLSSSDKIHHTDDGDDSPDDDENKAAIGAYIQWESEGALQFPTPRRVTGVSEDETFVFVEGSNTGIPMSEVQLAEKPEVPAISETPESQKRLPKKPGIIEATLPLEEGLAVLQVPDQLTAASFQDLDDWLKLLLRKAKRSVSEEEKVAD